MRFLPAVLSATTALVAGLAANSFAGAAPTETPAEVPARAEISTSVQVVPVRHGFELVETDSLLEGQSAVLREGLDGLRRRAVATTEIDGATRRELVLWSRVVRKPLPEVVAIGTAVPAPPEPEYVAYDPVWDQIAECESGGDWSINTGNGYYGGLQFSASTWSAMGGYGLPHENSRDEQIRIATALRDQNGGYDAWPACSAQLGLPG